MSNVKPSTTPLTTSPTLELYIGTILSNPTEYRTIIGNIQYLSLTQPEIAFTMSKPSQFMHPPTSAY